MLNFEYLYKPFFDLECQKCNEKGITSDTTDTKYIQTWHKIKPVSFLLQA